MLDLDEKYWVMDIEACAKHLSDDEFERLQGLVKKVDLLSKDKGQYYIVRRE